MRGWMVGVLLAVSASCAVDEPAPAPPAPGVVDVIWERTIRRGDVMILVPGTGTHDYLATPIEALAEPLVNVRTNATVASDSTVFEQAIAAARRAGLSDSEIEAGAVTFMLWGAGFQRLESFEYISYEGLRIRVGVLGGQNQVAVGFIQDNLLSYTWESVNLDARDMYTRLRDWLVAHPAPTSEPRNAVVVAHSWGGAVAEYLALEFPTIEAELGALPAGTEMPLTVAAGVPAFVLGYTFLGPLLRDVTRPSGAKAFIYEIDRPDDPVHNSTFEGDYGGHHYNILFGDEYRGSYGITTTDLSCHGVPGACE